MEKAAAGNPTILVTGATGFVGRRLADQALAAGYRVRTITRREWDGSPNVALESLALGCRAWITGTMNIVPRSARQLMRAVTRLHDLDLARRIYYRQILPFVDVMSRNFNPTGTIKAGVSARGVDVGAPRRPGNPVNGQDQKVLEKMVEEVVALEQQVEKELAPRT